MSVSLYDLLDVDEDASSAQIRTAWKAAIADLDPTDRRFRAYNDAAGVLLDPGKRAAYDAELAAERGDDAAAAGAAAPDEHLAPAPKMKAEPEPEPETGIESRPEPEVVGGGATVTERPVVTGVADADADADKDGEPADASDGPSSAGPPTWALLVAAGAAVLSVALLVVVLTWPGSLGDSAPADQVEQAEAAESAGATAVRAAEDAVPVVLSYDYRTLDADFEEAEAYLTDDFAAKRTELFEQQAESGMTLREQVVTDKVVVAAAVAGSGLVRVSEDGERASVVVFVNQDSQKGRGEPRPLRMWATLTMVLDGSDWLLDDICTETDCS